MLYFIQVAAMAGREIVQSDHLLVEGQKTLNQIGFVSAISLPFLLLLWRNRNWAAHPRRYLITLPLFGIGVLCLLAQYIVNADLKVLGMGLIWPLFAQGIEWLYSQWSRQVQGRDFYLWLRGSDDYEFGKKKFKFLDGLISMLLLVGHILIPTTALLNLS